MDYQLYIFVINCVSFVVNLIIVLMHHKNEGKVKRHISEMFSILTNPDIRVQERSLTVNEPTNEVLPTPNSLNEYVRPYQFHVSVV